MTGRRKTLLPLSPSCFASDGLPALPARDLSRRAGGCLLRAAALALRRMSMPSAWIESIDVPAVHVDIDAKLADGLADATADDLQRPCIAHVMQMQDVFQVFQGSDGMAFQLADELSSVSSALLLHRSSAPFRRRGARGRASGSMDRKMILLPEKVKIWLRIVKRWWLWSPPIPSGSRRGEGVVR